MNNQVYRNSNETECPQCGFSRNNNENSCKACRYHFLLKHHLQPEDTLSPQQQPKTSRLPSCLIVIEERHNSQQPSLSQKRIQYGSLVIGRDTSLASDNIAIKDNTVSSRHLNLRFTLKYGVEIKDNNSTNGTLLNSSRIEPEKWYTIHEDDEILIGRNTAIWVVMSYPESSGE